MPGHKVKAKRKLHKSGEKLSPKEKKSKESVSCKTSDMAEKAKITHGNKPALVDSEFAENPTCSQWKQLISKVSDICERTEGIEEIKTTLHQISKELGEFKSKFEALEKSVEFESKRIDTLEKKTEELVKTHDYIELLENELKATESENRLLKEQILSQESYSRRNNLLFDGIPEENGNDTFIVLKHFLISVFGLNHMEVEKLLIANCHRIGRYSENGPPRPIIAKFVLESDRNRIWWKKNSLKNLPYIIREDYPTEIQNRRKLLYPLYLEAKKRDNAAKLQGDKITFNRKVYNYAKAFELAEIINFFDKGIRRGNGFLAFHGRTSIYSNFFPATFHEGNTLYNCSEQMYQNELCMFFGDAQAARLVMLQSDPVAMKRIGDRVAKTDVKRKDEWYQKKAKNVMKTAVFLKFSKNPKLLNHFKTTTETFVEANPHDTVWGAGIKLHDDKILDPTSWQGTNWLGDILTTLRDKFKVK